MAGTAWLRALLAIVAIATLGGCLPEAQETGSEPLPRPSQSNSAPTIFGSPSTSAVVGKAYSFQPSARDDDGDALTFSATGLPPWANILPSSGMIWGTPSPSDVGTSELIVVVVSDGESSASLPTFRITVADAGSTAPNQPPAISGKPVTTMAPGEIFSFTPVASDPEGDALAFSLKVNGGATNSKPAWASFNVATGQLSGIAQTGTYNITITATDQKGGSASLSFTLTVTSAKPTGTAALSWSAPTHNTDGTVLIDLKGYKVYYGTNPNSLTAVAELTKGSSLPEASYTFNALASGNHYFAVTALNESNIESALSGVGSKTIP